MKGRAGSWLEEGKKSRISGSSGQIKEHKRKGGVEGRERAEKRGRRFSFQMREEKWGVGRGARRNFRMSLFGPPQSSAPALVLKGRGKRRRDGMGRPLEKKRRRGEGAGGTLWLRLL